jgi:hypothetical protein
MVVRTTALLACCNLILIRSASCSASREELGTKDRRESRI